jgi:acetylornithine deacetylase/succinyl-diaminopimelate desuccinylase-like protein
MRSRQAGRYPMVNTAQSPDCGRDAAIAMALAWFDAGGLFDALSRRVAWRTESQLAGQRDQLRSYLELEIMPTLADLGFACRILENPLAGAEPFLVAERIESPAFETVLMYAHGDVVAGYEGQWADGRSPWRLESDGERWFGRGSADNKGQHSINLAALGHVIAARKRLGFNVRMLFEMGEEQGSPGLRELCQRYGEHLAADVLIASDGPRLRAEEPTLFLGSRGAFNFDLIVELRTGAHHSGNWGGLLANPGTLLANAIASLVDERGAIRVSGLRPASIDPAVRDALARVEPGEPGGPSIDPDWGEPGLSAAERVYAWNTLEVLAFKTGNPEHPVNAIPGAARAHLQLRFVVGCDPATFVAVLREYLDSHGFARVRIEASRATTMEATRLSPVDPWVVRVAASLARTTGTAPTILPNIGGSLPNDCFAGVLKLPTVWIPHSYPGCAQHAPNEHLLQRVAREGLAIMVGLFWDLGDS